MSHVAKKQKTNNNNNMASTTLQSSTGSWVPYDSETGRSKSSNPSEKRERKLCKTKKEI